MTQVWRNEEHSLPSLVTALTKLKALRDKGQAGDTAVLGGLSLEEIDTVIDHCESTKGQFLLPDVPM